MDEDDWRFSFSGLLFLVFLVLLLSYMMSISSNRWHESVTTCHLSTINMWHRCYQQFGTNRQWKKERSRRIALPYLLSIHHWPPTTIACASAAAVHIYIMYIIYILYIYAIFTTGQQTSPCWWALPVAASKDQRNAAPSVQPWKPWAVGRSFQRIKISLFFRPLDTNRSFSNHSAAKGNHTNHTCIWVRFVGTCLHIRQFRHAHAGIILTYLVLWNGMGWSDHFWKPQDSRTLGYLGLAGCEAHHGLR